MKLLKLNKLRLIIFLVLAWLFCAAQSPIPAPTPSETRQEPQTSASDSGDESAEQNQPTSAAMPTVNQTTTPKTGEITSDDSDEESKPPPSDRWLTWFTGTLAVVAVLQLVALVCQGRQSQRTFEIGQRAYVTIQDVKIHQELLPDSDPSVAIEYRNSGRTPANVAMYAKTGFVGAFLDGVPTELFSDEHEFTRDDGLLIGPDVSRTEIISRGTLVTPAAPVARELIENVRKRNLYWRTWIRIRYGDTFGNVYGSIEVWLYSPEREIFEPITLGARRGTKKSES